MSLTPGRRVGAYEIVDVLGAGGMGEVYRAHDATLNRDVAIKVLLASVADDPDRLARFRREAQVLASLNHPNIAHIHGLEDFPIEGGGHVRALVMELVEGDDLAFLIARGPMPLDEALPIAKQIADALEAAHEQGVIHRDLKPANIKVRPDGTVKVLDFGLAKAMDPAGASSANAMNSPTLSNHATQAGIILGTAAYMSPEQAAGKAVDKRSDLWAFGVVLLEMLTGRPVFPGETVSHVLAAVLKSEPDWTTLPAETPAPIRRLLRRCLEKDRRRRIADAGDVRLELDEAGATADRDSGFVSRPTATVVPAWRRALPWALFAAASIAFVTALLLWSPWRATPALTTRITLALSRDNSLTIQNEAVAISSDGRTVVFAASSTQGSRLYIRRLDEWVPRPLPSTDGGSFPFFSPDGQWIAFQRGGNLEKMPVSGGPSQVICPAAGRAGHWRRDGTIVFGAWPNVGLWRVSSDGGTPQLIAKPSEGSAVQYLWPESLADDKGTLFTLQQAGRNSIAVLPPGADKPRILVESGSRPRYLPTGHLVYVADSRLWAVPFDVERLEVRGGATVVVDEVNGAYDVSTSGVLVYLPARSSASNIVWRDRQGGTVPVVTRSRTYESPALSPDGQRLSVIIKEGPSRNLWTGGVANDPLTRLTFGDDDWFGLWSPDGARLFYTSGQNGTYNVFSVLANGGGKAERLTQSPHPQQATSVSPAGDVLLMHHIAPSTGTDILALSLSSKEFRPVVQTRFDEGNARFSPDGRAIAYQSNESDQMEVYVQAYPGPGVKRRVSLDGGTIPFWSHTGRELFYQTATAVFSVPILDGRDLRTGPPVRLFSHTGASLAISADDQRFLTIEKADANQSASQLNLVQNWFEDLKTRVPRK